MGAVSLTALASSLPRLLAIIGEITGVVLPALALATFAGDLALHFRLHRGEPALRLAATSASGAVLGVARRIGRCAAVLISTVLIATRWVVVRHDEPPRSGVRNA